MAINRTPPLNERIESIRADIDALIDARVVETAKHCSGVPEVVLRNLITARTGGCWCATYLELKETDEKEAAA